MKKPIRTVLIGAGQRGMEAYGPYALQHPDEIQFVAVAEPDPVRRAHFANQHSIPPENQFESWEHLLAKPPLGQAALICTPDQLHTAPALAALEAGYDVLLEKPMATNLAECRLLVAAEKAHGKQLHICHVLRYTPHFQKMKTVVESGVLGEIINVSHRENVAWWHMAHSFVRGNWRNTAASSPMILAKCCHDLDILIWLLNDRCETLSSVGGLLHFHPQNAPPGAAERCLDGCAVAGDCPYHAPTIYIDHIPLWQSLAATGKGLAQWGPRLQLSKPGWVKALSKVIPALQQISDYRGWPSSAVCTDPSPQNLRQALKDGPYGRCVYHCDNDVVDHQVVSMKFERGTSVTLTMHGHAHLEGRTTRVEGSRATLTAAFWHGSSWIAVREHRSGRYWRYDTSAPLQSGHGGGDHRLMAGFVQALRGHHVSPDILTTAHQSLESHLMAFAAEEARLNQEVVQMADYRSPEK